MEQNTAFSVDGRTAIITGSGRNIGKAIALTLAENGASVIINGHRDQESVISTVDEIVSKGGEAAAFMADVSDPSSVSRMVGFAQEKFGSVDIVVSNVSIRRFQPFLDITIDDWKSTLDTNLNSAFYLAQAAIPVMIKHKWGRVINISGADGFAGATNRAHNVTCKIGLHGLVKAIAQEFGQNGITANTVVPGWIETDRDWSQYPTTNYDEKRETIPVRRIGSTLDVARACLFLASESGSYITGQAVHVNGGMHMI